MPTAAAVVLTFFATGAAVATSPQAHPVAFSQSAAAVAGPPAAAEFAVMRESAHATHLRTVANDLVNARTAAVARGVERRRLVVTATLAKRAELSHTWRLPITHPVKSSSFGYRWGRLHAGEDFAVSVGTPLASMSTGTVVFAGSESGYGNLVKIRYWDGTISFYGHMSSVSVNAGQAVDPGQIVGQSGNTGHSTGPHLHLEIHPSGGDPIDPLPWLAAHHVAT